MISTRKLLKYIDKHPHCSYKDIAKSLFDNDTETASKELMRQREYINGTQIPAGWSQLKSYKTFENISINSSGKQYLENRFNEKWRFRIPLIISIIALIVSIASVYFTYLQK